MKIKRPLNSIKKPLKSIKKPLDSIKKPIVSVKEFAASDQVQRIRHMTTKSKIIATVVVITIVALVVLLAITLIKYHDLSKNSVQMPSNLTQQEQTNLETFYHLNRTQNDFPYQKKYPNLYVDNKFDYKDESDHKICYLTFDDGPTPGITDKILDTLKSKDVKATFFVIDSDSQECEGLYKRMIDEGHTIGVHTASHDYDKIYASVDAYLEDFNELSEHLVKVTNVKPEIFRFPGGSVNGMNQKISIQLISEMIRRGYTYYDWTSTNGDAVSAVMPSPSAQVANATAYDEDKKILLMHDARGHENTAEALSGIIDGLRNMGYEFAPLTKEVKPVTFAYF